MKFPFPSLNALVYLFTSSLQEVALHEQPHADTCWHIESNTNNSKCTVCKKTEHNSACIQTMTEYFILFDCIFRHNC